MVTRDTATVITLTGIIDRIRTTATMQGRRFIGTVAIAIIATIVIIVTTVTGNNDVKYQIHCAGLEGIPSRLIFLQGR
jgi:hypothetical protein